MCVCECVDAHKQEQEQCELLFSKVSRLHYTNNLCDRPQAPLGKKGSRQLHSQLRIYTSSSGLLVYNGLVAAPVELSGSARLEDCCIEGTERAPSHILSVVDSERVSCERAGARHKRTRKPSEREKTRERERENERRTTSAVAFSYIHSDFNLL